MKNHGAQKIYQNLSSPMLQRKRQKDLYVASYGHFQDFDPIFGNDFWDFGKLRC